MGAAHIYCISVQLLQIDAQHRGHSKFHFKFSILSFFSEKSNLEKYLKISSMENDSAHINVIRGIAVKCWWVFSNPNEDYQLKSIGVISLRNSKLAVGNKTYLILY